MKQAKIDTLFKAQTRKVTPYSRGKQKPNKGAILLKARL